MASFLVWVNPRTKVIHAYECSALSGVDRQTLEFVRNNQFIPLKTPGKYERAFLSWAGLDYFAADRGLRRCKRCLDDRVLTKLQHEERVRIASNLRRTERELQ